MPEYPDFSKGEGLIRTYDLLEHLIADVDKAFETLEGNKASHYLRRCVARAVFSFVEGIIQIVKFETRSDIRMDRYSVELTVKEKEVLYEQRIVEGEAIPIRIPIEDNLKKTFRLAARLWGLTDYKLETDGEDYRDFLAAKDARNRLTHPRTYYDITVTDTDMHCYAVTFIWAKRQFKLLMGSKVKAIASELPEDVREKILGPNNTIEPTQKSGAA